MSKLYIADDEQSLLDILSVFLRRDGFEVTTFSDCDQIITACENELPDAVVLDIMMAGTDGLSACSALRSSYPALPIIIISAKDTPFDRVTGLTIGADDYLCKPFLPIELSARIKALLRRSQTGKSNEPPAESILTFGPLTLNSSRRAAMLSGEHLPLTPTEYVFLEYLMKHKENAVSREELMSTLWKAEWQADTRVTDDLVKRLRKKFRERNSTIQIETVWGYGFRLTLGAQN